LTLVKRIRGDARGTTVLEQLQSLGRNKGTRTLSGKMRPRGGHPGAPSTQRAKSKNNSGGEDNFATGIRKPVTSKERETRGSDKTTQEGRKTNKKTPSIPSEEPQTGQDTGTRPCKGDTKVRGKLSRTAGFPTAAACQLRRSP